MLSAVLMLYFGATAALNYLFDPFSFNSIHLIEYDRFELNRRLNVPLWTLVETTKIPREVKNNTTVVILGDSRARMLTGGYKTKRVRRVGDDVVYNLAIGGGRLNEFESIYYHELPYLDKQKIRMVVLTVPFTSLCKLHDIDRIEQIEDVIPYYYFHLYITRRSLTSMLYGDWKFKYSSNRIEYDARSLDEFEILEVPPEMDNNTSSRIERIEAKDKDVKKGMRRFRRVIKSGYRRIYSNLDEVSSFVRRLQAEGIEVVLWNPPLTDDFIQMIADLDGSMKYRRYENRMNSLSKFYDLCRNKYDYDIDYVFMKDIVHSANSKEIMSLIIRSDE